MQKHKFVFLRKTSNLILKLLPCLFWTLVILGFDTLSIGVLTILCAIIHEIGHIIALLIIDPQFSIYSALNGMRLKGTKSFSYKEELVIAGCGPLINTMLFGIFYCIGKNSAFLYVFAIINLMTAISNLLPIEGYDGYRITECLISIITKLPPPHKLLRGISFGIIAVFSFVSLYLMTKADGGYWMYLVFIALLIKKIKNDEKTFIERKTEKNRVFERF